MSVTTSLRDVAEAAGVSSMTVSRVLNGRGPVAASTRERVLTAAEQLGYQNNALTSLVMSHLRMGSSGSVKANLGFLTGDRDDSRWRKRAFYNMIFEGAAERSRELGCVLDPVWIRDPALKESRITSILQARGIKGVLLGTWIDGVVDPDLDWNEFKGVAIGYTVRTKLHRVANNQLQSMRISLERLTALGFKRIGVVYEKPTDERMNHLWSAAYAGWSQHLEKSRRVSPLILPNKNSLDAETFHQWRRAGKVDVVLMQGGMIRQLINQGLRFPEDIPAASLECHREDLPVAGIDRDFRLLGSVAVDILISSIITAGSGLPAVPLTTLVDTHWRDGFTLPSP